MDYRQLIQLRADLTAEAAGIFARAKAEGRSLTDEERQRDDEIDAKLTTINRDLVALERQRERERTTAAVPGVTSAAPSSHPVTVHDRAADRPYATMGEQMQSIAGAAKGSYSDRERLEVQAAAAGANEAVDSEGGFLIMPTFLGGIEQRMYSTGEVLSRVRPLEVGENSNGAILRTIDETSRATGSRLGGVRGYWVDEADSIGDSKPKFGRIELKLKKVAALGYATDELLADSTLMSSIYPPAFADELMFLVEDSIFSGDGASKPLGVIGHAATVSIAKETSQTAATVVFQNVLKMRARQYARSRKNSVWFINQELEEVLPQMSLVVGVGGVPVYLPASGASEDGYDRLFGRPVIPVEYCSALGTVGDIILADLSQYGMIRKGGVVQASSMHVKFSTDEMTFRATYRCDGAPLWTSALTPFKGTSGATLSPIVTLATRA